MIRKILLIFSGLIFLLFAFFQWNDPDALKWMLYYLLIAAVPFASLFKINKSMYIYALLIFSLVWMLTLLPNANQWFQDGMPSITESMKAESPYIELVREFLGLFISIIGLIFFLIDFRISSKK